MKAAKEMSREELEATVTFLLDREAYFSRLFKVSDAGQYRADWDGAVRQWENGIRDDERKQCAAIAERACSVKEDGPPVPYGADRECAHNIAHLLRIGWGRK